MSVRSFHPALGFWVLGLFFSPLPLLLPQPPNTYVSIPSQHPMFLFPPNTLCFYPPNTLCFYSPPTPYVSITPQHPMFLFPPTPYVSIPPQHPMFLFPPNILCFYSTSASISIHICPLYLASHAIPLWTVSAMSNTTSSA